MPSVEQVWPPYPPAGETDLDKALRLEEEKEAKRRSDEIDRALESQREELRKRKDYIKVLLLGQAESGKSTVLKQFQQYYAPKAFSAESEAWRAVIQLNLVRSVNFVLDILSGASTSLSNVESAATYAPSSSKPYITQRFSEDDDLNKLRMRLSPLSQVEAILLKRLSATDSRTRKSVPPNGKTPGYYERASEISVRGGTGWKELVRRKTETRTSLPDDLDDARRILDACKEDIAALWTSPQVQERLAKEGVSLRDQSGFFLDEAARIASISYAPPFQDILKARLQTMGVEEHEMVMESLSDNQTNAGKVGSTWIFYDVGGCRSQRATWAPYFEDVNAMIFLCSMAGFDQVLVEDRTTNRLFDSLTIWKTVCSSKLLANVTFILLMNKTDLLQAKLDSGKVFSRYVNSYKGRNNAQEIIDYLKRKFEGIHRSFATHSRQRTVHMHATCAIDVVTMSTILVRIREAILVNSLRSVDLI